MFGVGALFALLAGAAVLVGSESKANGNVSRANLAFSGPQGRNPRQYQIESEVMRDKFCREKNVKILELVSGPSPQRDMFRLLQKEVVYRCKQEGIEVNYTQLSNGPCGWIGGDLLI